MRTTNHDENGLQGDNLRAVQDYVTANRVPHSIAGLSMLVADMMDEIAQGKDRYMTIGSTRNRSAFVVSVKGPGCPDPVYAADFEELSVLAADLL